MSRQFPDTSGITLAVGSAGVLDGAWSFAAVVKQTTRSTQSLVSQQASTHNRGGLWLTSAGLLQASSGAGNSATFGITLPLNVWALVAITRVAGPNKTPRGHMYRYDTGVWAHANGNAALDNDTTAITHIELGRSFSDWFYIGLMANAGAWDRALSDVEVEGLELALQAWVDATPVALWPLNQASTATAVQDIIGAADQTSITGTSVSADEPAGWSYTLGGGGSTVSGVATAVLGGLTAAAAGDRTVHGAAVASLGGLTATAVGDRTVNAISTTNLGALTGTASGQRTTYATATASLGGLTATASGAGASAAGTGTGQALLGALTATAVGRRTAHGIVTADLGALAAAVAGLRTIHGTATAALGVLTGTGAGADENPGGDPRITTTSTPGRATTTASGRITTSSRTGRIVTTTDRGLT